ncbi:MAG: twin-arginine translocation signal domain-containing protein [Planctomycetota bacterium]
MIDKQIMNRRSFLKGTLAAAGGFFIVPRYVLGGRTVRASFWRSAMSMKII